ncbi:MAG: hypothetical protein RL748_2353 [Pseudomonadota bacterium]
MELLFTGTSSGAPTKTRNVTGLALKMSHGKSWYLVDCGEGTQHRILHLPLSLATLKAIFITHVHGDHCYGLPGLLGAASLNGRRAPLQIIGPPEIEAWLNATRSLTQLHLTFDLNFTPVADGEICWQDQNLAVQALPLSHRATCHAYAFTEQNIEPRLDLTKLQTAGIAPGPFCGLLRQGQNVTLADGRTLLAQDFLLPPAAPRKVIIGGDNDNPGLLLEAAQDAQVLVHEATYTEAMALKVGPGPRHSHARAVAQMAQQAGLPNLILTHFSARYQDMTNYPPSIKDIADEAAASYQGHLFLARDFDHFQLDSHDHLTQLARSTPQASL